MSEQDELLRDFLLEANEHLDHLDEELLALETSPTDSPLIHSIFRRLHTIKGVCGFLYLHELERVSHAGETLLDKLRSSAISVDDQIINLLLRLNDAIRTILSTIETTGSEGGQRFEAITKELLVAAKLESVAAPTSAYASLDDEFEALLDERDAYEAEKLPYAPENCTPSPPPHLYLSSLLRDQEGQTQGEPPTPSIQSDSNHTTFLRVDVTLLDKLTNLAGELVLARNQILQTAKHLEDPILRQITQRLNLVTSELQEGVMKTRMQPINTVFSKFPRVVRELALTCNKQVRLEVHGKETELDKTLVEAIRDPLTHILRNAVDHGIESPDRRASVGKPRDGTITIGAFQEGGYVVIEVADDGAGLDTTKIRERGIECGLISPDQAPSMTEAEVYQLIFAPGFSTSDSVSAISGRGVGMDVVKSSIEGIGGHVDITSLPNKGSSIRLKIPLTLAIIPALLLSCNGHRFAIPQSAVTELVHFNSSASSSALSWIGASPFYTLREELIPIIFLNRHLKIHEQTDTRLENRVVVIMDVDSRRFGLAVDVVYDTAEIVVKPLGSILRKLQIYAGATILGDGQIALIIDPLVLARDCRIERVDREGHIINETAPAGPSECCEPLLIAQISPEMRVGIPLSQVLRLEEFTSHDIERLGESSVIQYRGAVLSLIDVAEALGLRQAEWRGGSVVVLELGERTVGLQVQRILDISSHITAISPVEGKPGIRSFAVVQGNVIAQIDLEYLLERGAAPASCVTSTCEVSV